MKISDLSSGAESREWVHQNSTDKPANHKQGKWRPN